MKKIFDPAKIAALTRQFEQKAIARDNEALVSRLQKVAVAKTTITKTNDPKERRYVNKVAKDKMRMLRQSKQHLLNELNFENKLMLHEHAISNRDNDHESFLSFVSIVRHGTAETARDIRSRQRRRLRRPRGIYQLDIDLLLDMIHCFTCGRSETRSLWFHIVEE